MGAWELVSALMDYISIPTNVVYRYFNPDDSLSIIIAGSGSFVINGLMLLIFSLLLDYLGQGIVKIIDYVYRKSASSLVFRRRVDLAQQKIKAQQRVVNFTSWGFLDIFSKSKSDLGKTKFKDIKETRWKKMALVFDIRGLVSRIPGTFFSGLGIYTVITLIWLDIGRETIIPYLRKSNFSTLVSNITNIGLLISLVTFVLSFGVSIRFRSANAYRREKFVEAYKKQSDLNEKVPKIINLSYKQADKYIYWYSFLTKQIVKDLSNGSIIYDPTGREFIRRPAEVRTESYSAGFIRSYDRGYSIEDAGFSKLVRLDEKSYPDFYLTAVYSGQSVLGLQHRESEGSNGPKFTDINGEKCFLISRPYFSVSEEILFSSARTLQKPLLRNLILYPFFLPRVGRMALQSSLTRFYNYVLPYGKSPEAGWEPPEEFLCRINDIFAKELELANAEVTFLAEWCAKAMLYRDSYKGTFMPVWVRKVIDRGDFS